MERINYRITLDAHKNGIQRTLQGFEIADNMSRRISVNLTASGDTYEIPFDHVTAVMYVTTPNAKEPSIEACTIEDNTVIYDMLPITEEGITEMQMKLIETRMDGSKSVLLSPKFAIEVSSSNADDGGATQTPTFTALEDALARAKSVYDARLFRIEIDDACVFRAYYADGTVYENYALHEALYNGNALLSESWAKGGTGIREGEDTNNSMYFSNVSRSAAEDADMVYADARGLLNEAIRHTAFTSFLVDFENGNLEYMSSNSTFDVNEENGDLEFQLSNDYDPEKLVGDVVAEYVEEQSKEIEERLQNVDANTFKGHGISDFAMKGSILDTMEEINANTQDNQLAGANAVKELRGDLSAYCPIQGFHDDVDALTYAESILEKYEIAFVPISVIGASGSGASYSSGFITTRWDTCSVVLFNYQSGRINVNSRSKSGKWTGWEQMAFYRELYNYLPLSGGYMQGDIHPSETDKYYLGLPNLPWMALYANNLLMVRNGVNYGHMQTTNGTKDRLGACILCLGNDIPQGSDNNAYGLIRLHNKVSGYTDLNPTSDKSVVLNLPTENGYLVNAAAPTHTMGVFSFEKEFNVNTPGDYGMITAHGASRPGKWDSDTYYHMVTNLGKSYNGWQTGGATDITWRRNLTTDDFVVTDTTEEATLTINLD